MTPSLVIVGLGNTGSTYSRTRHNVGWWALDLLHREVGCSPWRHRRSLLASAAEARLITAPLLLVKPSTLMNRSGETVAKLQSQIPLISPDQLLVLTDDVDLPAGRLRLRSQGSPGTHNGLKSVTEQIGKSFPRLRIGIGAPPPGSDLTAYVLSQPTPEEEEPIRKAIERIPSILRLLVIEGFAAAQAEANRGA